MASQYKDLPAVGAGSVTTVTATSPLSSTGGTAPNLTIATASAFTSGALGASDYTAFFNKVGLLGNAAIENSVLFFTSTGLSSPPIANTSDLLFFDSINRKFRVGGTAGDEVATIHGISDLSEAIPAPISFSASLIQFVLPSSPSVTATQTTPDIQSPTFSANTTNTGAGGYPSSTIIDYEARAGFDDGVNPVTWGVSTTPVIGITDSGTGDFDVQFSLGSGLGNLISNVWIVKRNVNSGSSEWIQTNNPSYVDNNSGWGPEPDSSNRADDFLANNTPQTILGYGTNISPISTTIVSMTGFNPSFVDDNSGTAYKIQVDPSGGDAPYRFDWPGGRNYESSTSFTSGPIGPTNPGAPILTPNTYGYASDGNILNRSYDFYSTGTLDGKFLYSQTSISQTTTDPNNGNYYYIALGSFNPDGKVIGPIGGKFVIIGDSFFDDNVTVFPDGTNTTPNVFLKPAVIAEAAMTASQGPQLVVKAGTGEAFTKLEFQTGSGVTNGYIIADATGFRIGNINQIVFNAIAPTNAVNNTLFKDSGTGKLSFKDNSGTTHALY